MGELDYDEILAENEALKAELEELRAELEELRADADLDACHVAGLTAQIKALIAEGDACPDKSAHPLLERAQYTHSRTGELVTKTKAFPLYREAFDAEAHRLGIENPEKIRG
jgi:cell division septum initiation protein DivIVA